MAAHFENKTTVQIGLEQVEALTHEAFRMADRIVARHVESFQWNSDEAKDRYLATTPLIALEIRNQLVGLCGIQNANPLQVQQQQDSLAEIISELKKRNDAGRSGE
jgi:hypothetical protein